MVQQYIIIKYQVAVPGDLEKFRDMTRKQIVPNIMLTKREIELLNLMQQGYTTRKLAELLTISVRTVETHRRNINEKLAVHNTTAALHKARLLQMIK